MVENISERKSDKTHRGLRGRQLSGDFSSFELSAPAQPPAAALLQKSAPAPCSANQQLTTFCLTHLFAGLYITGTLATTDEFSKTWRRPPSGSRCAVCRSDTSPPLLPENALCPTSFERHLSCRSALQRLDHQPTNDRAAVLDPEKASSDTRMRSYRRTPCPPSPPAAGRRSSVIEIYAPSQDPEAANPTG